MGPLIAVTNTRLHIPHSARLNSTEMTIFFFILTFPSLKIICSFPQVAAWMTSFLVNKHYTNDKETCQHFFEKFDNQVQIDIKDLCFLFICNKKPPQIIYDG